MTTFSYRRGTQEFNDLVEEAVEFASAILNNTEIANKEERILEHNKGVAKYCLAGTRYEALYEEKGLEALKDPRVMKNADVHQNFDAFISEIINPVLPIVSNSDFARLLAEVRQIGWGDTARFIVHSNELYKVNEIAEGVNRGVLEPIHDNEFTLDTKVIEIAAQVDIYAVAAGVFDFGDFAVRAARSFEQYTFIKIVKAVTSGFGDFGAAYAATGFSVANWSGLAEKVSLANGKCPVIALGTLEALNTVYPSQTGLQFGLGEEIAKKGFLDKYMGVRLLPIENAFSTPWGVNTDAAMALTNDKIYFVPTVADRPVKIVYEGNTTVVERDADHSTDKTYTVRIQMRQGVGFIAGSKYGTLDLTSST